MGLDRARRVTGPTRRSGGVRPCGVGSRSPRPPARPLAHPRVPPRSRCAAWREGAGPRQWEGAREARLCLGPRGRRVGAPRGEGGDTGHPGTASAHLDEELDEGLFVLLLQPVQGHRQRHGRLGSADCGCWLWLRGCCGCGLPPRSLSLARSLDSPDVKLPARGHRTSAPPHASRATRRGLRSQLLQTAGRDPLGVVWAGQRPGALDSAGEVGGTSREGRGLGRRRRGRAVWLPRRTTGEPGGPQGVA